MALLERPESVDGWPGPGEMNKRSGFINIDFGAELGLTQVLVQIPSKRVVIVDHQHMFRGLGHAEVVWGKFYYRLRFEYTHFLSHVPAYTADGLLYIRLVYKKKKKEKNGMSNVQSRLVVFSSPETRADGVFVCQNLGYFRVLVFELDASQDHCAHKFQNEHEQRR